LGEVREGECKLIEQKDIKLAEKRGLDPGKKTV
jgi:hypothetical protein